MHGIVYRQSSRYATPGAVDVEVDGFLRVLGFEEEELGYYAGGSAFVDFAVEADDAFF